MNYKLAGVDLVELANQYEQSLYVYDLEEIDKRIEILSNLNKRYNKMHVSYASKAFLTKSFVQYISKNSDFGMDAVSIGEVFVQVQGGLDPKKILFHGNNKEHYELEQAFEMGVENLVIDCIEEYYIVKEIVKAKNINVNLQLRIAPSLEGIKTHKFITTASKDTKFGLPINSGQIEEIIKDSNDERLINICGFHFHIGSQLLSNESHVKALDVLLSLMEKYERELNYVPQVINIGGGFGVTYVDEEEINVNNFMEDIYSRVEKYFSDKENKLPEIWIEPGRWLVANAGVTLYKIGNTKEIENVRTYVSVNGGMNDNLRVSLYGAKYDVVVANKLDEVCDKVVTIAGKNCESSDILFKDVKVPSSISRGDILLVKTTGAYHHSMANNYNKLLIPTVVFVKNGKSYQGTRTQTLQDLLHNDIDINW